MAAAWLRGMGLLLPSPGSAAEGGRSIQGWQSNACLEEGGGSCVHSSKGPFGELNSPSLSCSHCSFVLEELKFLPTDERSREHKARCLWFLDTLIRFSHLKVIKKKRKRLFSS